MDITEIINNPADYVSLADVIILAGLMIFGSWLLKTSFGIKALAGSFNRPNNMPLYLPFAPFFIWMAATIAGVVITNEFFADIPPWKDALIENLILVIAAGVTILLILHLAAVHFTQRLTGFGFRMKSIVRDFCFALVNLLSVWPLLMLAVFVTTIVGKFFCGPDFQIRAHQELQLITDYHQPSLRILIFFVTVIAAPLLEEMLFRGMLQTAIRSHLIRPWPSIFITSAVFTVVHANFTHWPALFVLGVTLGYAYEKSGSLFRPIFIHMLFNCLAVISVLLQ